MMIRANCARRVALLNRAKAPAARNGLALSAATLASLSCLPAHAESGWHLLNMTQGGTATSRRIYALHMLIFYICCIIAVVVFGAMIWSIVNYRKSNGAIADTSMVHNTKVEILWTAVPVAILIGMAVPAAHTLVDIED